MIELIAWQGNDALKSEVVARIEAHRKADEIVQGEGYSGGRGCAVGCSLDSYDHGLFARTFGVQLEVARLVDAIHEGLTAKESVSWPSRVAMAIEPGAYTSLVWVRWAVWMLGRVAKGRPEKITAAIDTVRALYERRLAGDEPTREEWLAARSTATATAAAAAAAAADAAARKRYWRDAAKELARLLKACPERKGGAR